MTKVVLLPESTGLPRDEVVNVATRKSLFIHKMEMGDPRTLCSGTLYEVKFGAGPCPYRCRCCYLYLTHYRTLDAEATHTLYENTGDLLREVDKWLGSEKRSSRDTLGLGAVCSDALLLEGDTGLVRQIIPKFADPEQNPHGCLLLLLTKSANVQYLEGLPTGNVIVSFSVSPEKVADAWEGKYLDSGERRTPPISTRLAAALEAQRMGYDMRLRIDPILDISGWAAEYEAFFEEMAAMGLRPRICTLGSYREKQPSLRTFAAKHGAGAVDYVRPDMKKDGTHYHLLFDHRVGIYRDVIGMIRRHLPESRIGLCEETADVHRALGLTSGACNCMNLDPEPSMG